MHRGADSGAAPGAELRHGTAIAQGDAAALLVGPSGSGKSDLALRCLALPPGPFCPEPFRLVSDDQTVLSPHEGRIRISPPATIAGRIEVRGLGIVEIAAQPEAELALIVHLVAGPVERMPSAAASREWVCGREIARLELDPFEASAPIKLALALQQAAQR